MHKNAAAQTQPEPEPVYGIRRLVLDLRGLKPDTVGDERISIEIPVVDRVDYDYELQNLVKAAATAGMDEADLDYLRHKIYLAIDRAQIVRYMASRMQ